MKKSKRNILILILVASFIALSSGFVVYAAFTYKVKHECTVQIPDDLKQQIEELELNSGGGN